MLKILITGNLGQDAKISQLQNGDSIIGFSVAHTSKAANGESKTTWINCNKYVKQGGSTAVAQYLVKGQKVLIEGMPYINEYNGQDGNKISSLACRVYELELLGSAQGQGQGVPAQGVPTGQATTWAQTVQQPAQAQPQFGQQGNWNGGGGDGLPF
jgi:single-strand DNA-binding protein